MDEYYPEGDRSDGANIYGYLIAQTLMQVLQAVRQQPVA